MALRLSKRSGDIVQAEIRAMTLECDRVGGINLAQGVCDTGVPPPIREAVQAAVDEGFNSYTRYDGLRELREAIARKVARYNGLEADPETEIVVSAGSTGSLYCACLALLDPGDEVIVFEPYYGYHLNTLLAVGAVPVSVMTRPQDWSFASEDLARSCTKRTRALVINTPTNPCGKVFTEEELKEIAAVAVERDLLVFTDEIYEHFLYDGSHHVSPATIPGMRERTITISGFSKVLSITGWRLGYSISDARFTETIGFMNDLVYVCGPSPLQRAVAIGLGALDDSFYWGLAAQYAMKRDRVCGALSSAGLTPHVPQGAYYVLADVSRLEGRTSKQNAMRLLAETGVAGVPGEAFFSGPEGANLIRFCFAKDDAELEEAVGRLQAWR